MNESFVKDNSYMEIMAKLQKDLEQNQETDDFSMLSKDIISILKAVRDLLIHLDTKEMNRNKDDSRNP